MLHSLTIPMAADQALAWLLTYALHSTLLLVSAWAVTRRLGGRRLRLQETIWRCALLGALVTAPAQLALGQLGHAPIAGSWTLAAGDEAPAATPARPTETGTAAMVAEPGMGMPASPATAVGAAGLAWREERQGGAKPGSRDGRVQKAAAESAAPAGARRLLERTLGRAWASLRQLLLPAWLLGALALTLGYGRSYLALRRRLRYRPQVVGGGVVARLAGLVRESGLTRRVRLTCTWRLRVPVALGMRVAEVCVPPRALFQLDDEQQDALLAHELAHLARRDPVWLPLTQVVVAVFFFQPLNWLARRRLGELSELLSDEWAVARTGRPLSLAGCLAEVAGWSLAGRGASTVSRRAARLPVPGMAAGRPSQLAHRIRRLLDGAPSAAMTQAPMTPLEGPGPARRRHAILLAAVPTVLLAVTLAAPGVSAGSSPAPATAPACSAGFATSADVAQESVVACGGHTATVASAGATRPAASAAQATASAASAVAPEAAEAGASPAARASIVVAALAPPEAQEPAAAAAPEAADLDARAAASPSAASASPAAAAAPPNAEAAVAGPAPPAASSTAVPRSPAARDLDAERARLAAAAARLEQLDKLGTLSREQIKAITASAERISREIDGRLGEQLEQLNHQLAGAHAALPHLADLPAAEMAELGAELAAMTAQLHPSAQEMAAIDAEMHKLAAEQPHLSAEEIEHIQEDAMRGLRQLPKLGLSQAEIDRLHADVERALKEMPKLHLSQADLDRLRGEMKRTLEESVAARSQAMSPAEREKLVADARHLAERLRPDQAQLEAMRNRMRHDHEDLARALAEQRAEIEAMRRELQQQTQALRDQARRLTDARRAHPKSSSVPRPPRPPAPARPAAPAAPAAPAGPAAPAAPAAPAGAAPPDTAVPPAPEPPPAPEAPPPPPSCAG